MLKISFNLAFSLQSVISLSAVKRGGILGILHLLRKVLIICQSLFGPVALSASLLPRNLKLFSFEVSRA